ncbi:IS66 family transposase [Tritonibacter mobilis]|uniref:IS66 family transposase n=1 Tax=Tritonibacter mobilis TaxID=379347 RepID=UPI0039A48F0B
MRLRNKPLAIHAVVGKFCDHLPFRQQAEIERLGRIDRTMLANLMGRVAFHLAPFIDVLIDGTCLIPTAYVDPLRYHCRRY